MRKTRQITAAILISIMCFFTAGCGAVIVGGAAAAGTYYYMDGQAKGTYNSSLNKAYNAAQAACKELQIPVTELSKNGASASVIGSLSDDTVTISLKLVGDNITEITVRVGLWGNEESSHRIQNAIAKRL